MAQDVFDVVATQSNPLNAAPASNSQGGDIFDMVAAQPNQFQAQPKQQSDVFDSVDTESVPAVQDPNEGIG